MKNKHLFRVKIPESEHTKYADISPQQNCYKKKMYVHRGVSIQPLFPTHGLCYRKENLLPVFTGAVIRGIDINFHWQTL